MFNWVDGRWRWNNKPIHAGELWLLKCPDGELDVRIESVDQGKILVAHSPQLGRKFTSLIDTDRDQLRDLS